MLINNFINDIVFESKILVFRIIITNNKKRRVKLVFFYILH